MHQMQMHVVVDAIFCTLKEHVNNQGKLKQSFQFVQLKIAC